MYNMSILEDMFLEENAGFIRKTFNGWRCLEEALVLLKVLSKPSILVCSASFIDFSITL